MFQVVCARRHLRSDHDLSSRRFVIRGKHPRPFDSFASWQFGSLAIQIHGTHSSLCQASKQERSAHQHTSVRSLPLLIRRVLFPSLFPFFTHLYDIGIEPISSSPTTAPPASPDSFAGVPPPMPHAGPHRLVWVGFAGDSAEEGRGKRRAVLGGVRCIYRGVRFLHSHRGARPRKAREEDGCVVEGREEGRGSQVFEIYSSREIFQGAGAVREIEVGRRVER